MNSTNRRSECVTSVSETATIRATVFIVDDDEGVRGALGILLDSVGYVHHAYTSAAEFLRRYDVTQPGCLVLDIRMPEMSGLELQQELRRRGMQLPVIFITGHGDVPMAVAAMQQGAFDFVQKPFRDQELLDRINRALQLDARSRETAGEFAEIRRRMHTLTAREQEVLSLVVAGKANKVIALDLNLSERTVEIHRARAMQKMKARSVAQLVKMAMSLPLDQAGGR